ncbi:hypothetical protein ACWEKM_09525 [Streptomyces sp. NPDC004752]
MRAQYARRVVGASAAGILVAAGAAIGAAGTAAAATPTVHTRVTTDRCFDRDCFDRFDHFGRFDQGGFCFNNPEFCFGNGFDHGFGFGDRFGDRFDNGAVVIIAAR